MLKIVTARLVAIGMLLVLPTGCSDASAQPIQDGIYASPSRTPELSLVKGKWFINHGQFKPIEEGTYTFSANQIKFTLDKADPADECDPPTKTFVYQWDYTGKSLTLTKVEVNCGIRILT